MRKLIILLTVLMFISLQAAGCSKNKTDKGKSEGQTIEAISKEQKNNILRIAYNSLDELDKNLITDWKEGIVGECKFTNDHSIAGRNGLLNIKDIDTYRVCFSTNNASLGQIVIYIDKNSCSLLGFDIRN